MLDLDVPETLNAGDALLPPGEDEPTSRRADAVPADLDAEALLAATLADAPLLEPDEERILARRIVRARRRVRRILRSAPALSRHGLADAGRGVVRPEQDFREREAVAIHNAARRLLRDPAGRRALKVTLAEVRDFCAELADALAAYRAVRDEMIRANIRLVSVLARRYRHPTLSYLDLFQEGVIGLFRAVEKYDPARTVKFSTYATWWIWQQLGRAADTQGALIRTPVHWNQFRRRHARSAGQPAAAPAPDTDETADPDPLRFDHMAHGFRFVSTDAPLGEDDDRPLEAVLPDERAHPDQATMNAALRTHLDRAIDTLPPRERFILRRRFGLDAEPQTLDEIGQCLGVSRERIRQLENRALAQLKLVCSRQGLRDYLN